MSDDRDFEKTRPPTDIAYADPSGAVMFAEAADDDGPAGFVWVALSIDARPRAGIVLLHPNVRPDPSTVMQEDLGELTLRLYASSDADANDVMTYLAETRDGQGGKATVADFRAAANLDAVRRQAGWQT